MSGQYNNPARVVAFNAAASPMNTTRRKSGGIGKQGAHVSDGK
jgi:hypothetical protein